MRRRRRRCAQARYAEEIEARKSYSIPALDIIGFEILVNRYNRYFGNCCRDDYRVSGHPSGATCAAAGAPTRPVQDKPARPSVPGLDVPRLRALRGPDYWESLGYALRGQPAWEIAGENTRPSRNDQIASGVGGTFLGEALFRMSSLVLEKADGVPQLLARGRRGGHLSGHGLQSASLSAIASTRYFEQTTRSTTRASGLGAMGITQNVQGSSTTPKAQRGADRLLARLWPAGGCELRLPRPFDYFTFQATASSANRLRERHDARHADRQGNTRQGRNYRGIWGPLRQLRLHLAADFRVSSTALSLGTTASCGWRTTCRCKAPPMAGVGYAGVGTVRTASDTNTTTAPRRRRSLRRASYSAMRHRWTLRDANTS
jgi:hypothetical protein